MRYFKQAIVEGDPAFNLMRLATHDAIGDLWHPSDATWRPHSSLTVSLELNNDWDEIPESEVPRAKADVRARYERDLVEIAAEDARLVATA